MVADGHVQRCCSACVTILITLATMAGATIYNDCGTCNEVATYHDIAFSRELVSNGVDFYHGENVVNATAPFWDTKCDANEQARKWKNNRRRSGRQLCEVVDPATGVKYAGHAVGICVATQMSAMADRVEEIGVDGHGCEMKCDHYCVGNDNEHEMPPFGPYDGGNYAYQKRRNYRLDRKGAIRNFTFVQGGDRATVNSKAGTFLIESCTFKHFQRDNDDQGGYGGAVSFEEDGGVVRNAFFEANRGLEEYSGGLVPGHGRSLSSSLYFLNIGTQTNLPMDANSDYRKAMSSVRSGVVEGCIFKQNENPKMGCGALGFSHASSESRVSACLFSQNKASTAKFWGFLWDHGDFYNVGTKSGGAMSWCMLARYGPDRRRRGVSEPGASAFSCDAGARLVLQTSSFTQNTMDNRDKTGSVTDTDNKAKAMPAVSRGGAFAAFHAAAVLNCTFAENKAVTSISGQADYFSHGGAVAFFVQDGRPTDQNFTIRNCAFHSNMVMRGFASQGRPRAAGDGGAAVHVDVRPVGSETSIESCTFSGNCEASHVGGDFFSCTASTPSASIAAYRLAALRLTDCTFAPDANVLPVELSNSSGVGVEWCDPEQVPEAGDVWSPGPGCSVVNVTVVNLIVASPASSWDSGMDYAIEHTNATAENAANLSSIFEARFQWPMPNSTIGTAMKDQLSAFATAVQTSGFAGRATCVTASTPIPDGTRPVVLLSTPGQSSVLLQSTCRSPSFMPKHGGINTCGPSGWEVINRCGVTNATCSVGERPVLSDPYALLATCEACAATPGYYCDGLSAIMKPCHLGDYCPDAGSSPKQLCPAGSFCSDPSTRELCPAGRAGNGQGRTAMALCGGLSDNAGCEVECDAGSYAPAGSVACVICPAGHFTATAGMQACEACEAGRFSPRNKTACQSCDFGSTTAPQPGSANCTNCSVCAAGTYMTAACALKSNTVCEVCQSCPVGERHVVSCGSDNAGQCQGCDAGTFLAATAFCADGIESLRGSYGSINGEQVKVCCDSACGACEGTGCPGRLGGFEKCCPGHIRGTAVFCTNSSSTACIIPPAPVETCTKCPQGFVVAASGKLTCTMCEEGQHMDEMGKQSCKTCGIGQYQDSPGQLDCKTCQVCGAGMRRQNCLSMSGGDCVACGDGQFKLSPTNLSNYTEQCMLCKTCPKGTRVQKPDGCATKAGDRVCVACALGTSMPAPNQDRCLKCAAGRFQDESGESECKACLVCNASRLLYANNQCSGCAADRKTCTNDTICHDCQGKDALCPAGKHRTNCGGTTSGSCDACPKAFFKPTVHDQNTTASCLNCTRCDVGFYSHATQNCEEAGATLDTMCMPCQVCEAGKYRVGCGDLAPGTCDTCEHGKFKASFGADYTAMCSNWTATCGVNKYTAAAGTSKTDMACSPCDVCPTGQRRLDCGALSAGRCESCPGGTYLVNASVCVDCPRGFFVAAGQDAIACTMCGEGQFVNRTGKTTCESCDSGQFQDKQGKTGCATCAPGQFTGSASQALCVECATGEYQDKHGRSTCKTCLICNSSLHLFSAARCSSCPEGETRKGCKADTMCEDCQGKDALCPAGKHRTGCGADTGGSCDACPKAFFKAAIDNQNTTAGCRNCTLCPVGFHAHATQNCEEAGASTDAFCMACNTCGAGKYRVGCGGLLSGSCMTCEPRKYKASFGADYAVTCSNWTETCGSNAYTLAVGTAESDMVCSPCDVCPTGQRRLDCGALSAGRCDGCPGGTYLVNASVCVDCPRGFFIAAGQSAITCTMCEAGQHMDEMGKQSCKTCENGWYQGIPGQIDCKQGQVCGAGKYKSAEGTTKADKVCTSCAACPIDEQRKNCVGTNEGYCEGCALGRFLAFAADGTEMRVCHDCPRGYYGADKACKQCPQGTIQPEPGNAACVVCIGTGRVSSDDRTQCSCDAGFVDTAYWTHGFDEDASYLPTATGNTSTGNKQLNCGECPVGAVCCRKTMRDMAASGLPFFTVTGYWRAKKHAAGRVPEGERLYECPFAEACLGIDVDTPCGSSIIGDALQNQSTVCTIGHRGPACGVCIDSYAFDTEGRCIDCVGDGTSDRSKQQLPKLGMLLGVTLLVVAVLTIRELQLSRKDMRENSKVQDLDEASEVKSSGEDLNSLNVLLPYLQRLGAIDVALPDIKNLFPTLALNIIDILKFFYANLSFIMIAISPCHLHMTYAMNLGFGLMIVPWLGFTCVIVHCFMQCLMRKFRRWSSAESRARLLGYILYGAKFLHPFISQVCLQIFLCTEIGEGSFFVDADLSITCSYDDVRYMLFATISLVGCACLVVGIPAVLLLFVVWDRRRLRKDDRIEKQKDANIAQRLFHNESVVERAANSFKRVRSKYLLRLHAKQHRSVTPFTFGTKPQFYWLFIVDMGISFVFIALLQTLARGYVELQITLSIIMAVIQLLVPAALQPYEDWRDTEMAIVGSLVYGAIQLTALCKYFAITAQYKYVKQEDIDAFDAKIAQIDQALGVVFAGGIVVLFLATVTLFADYYGITDSAQLKSIFFHKKGTQVHPSVSPGIELQGTSRRSKSSRNVPKLVKHGSVVSSMAHEFDSLPDTLTRLPDRVLGRLPDKLQDEYVTAFRKLYVLQTHALVVGMQAIVRGRSARKSATNTEGETRISRITSTWTKKKAMTEQPEAKQKHVIARVISHRALRHTAAETRVLVDRLAAYSAISKQDRENDAAEPLKEEQALLDVVKMFSHAELSGLHEASRLSDADMVTLLHVQEKAEHRIRLANRRDEEQASQRKGKRRHMLRKMSHRMEKSASFGNMDGGPSAVFAAMDTDGSGLISIAELLKTDLFAKEGHDELEAMLATMDKDGDATTLTFDEFEELFFSRKGNKSRLKSVASTTPMIRKPSVARDMELDSLLQDTGAIGGEKALEDHKQLLQEIRHKFKTSGERLQEVLSVSLGPDFVVDSTLSLSFEEAVPVFEAIVGRRLDLGVLLRTLGRFDRDKDGRLGVLEISRITGGQQGVVGVLRTSVRTRPTDSSARVVAVKKLGGSG